MTNARICIRSRCGAGATCDCPSDWRTWTTLSGISPWRWRMCARPTEAPDGDKDQALSLLVRMPITSYEVWWSPPNLRSCGQACVACASDQICQLTSGKERRYGSATGVQAVMDYAGDVDPSGAYAELQAA